MNTKRILETISQTISALEKLHQELASGETSATVQVPDPVAEMVRQKMEQRICLMCEEPIPLESKAKRGLHSRCYTQHLEAIQSGEITDQTAVEQGAIAPRGKGGRTKKETKTRSKIRKMSRLELKCRDSVDRSDSIAEE